MVGDGQYGKLTSVKVLRTRRKRKLLRGMETKGGK